jgi:predicted choloylglycine hydrolase
MADVALQTFSGTHNEIGVQQGRTVRQLVQQVLRQIPHFEDIKSMKPRWLPTSLFLALAKRRAFKLLGKDIFEHYPKQAQRLKGIAEGAGIDIPTLLFMQAVELFRITESDYRLQACTSLGFSPQRTATAETIIAKNFDYPNQYEPYHLTCRTNPNGRFRTLGCTMAPLPGMLDGMNEHGLTVTYNLADTTDTPKSSVPLSIVLQEMLETCKNTDEAVEFVTNAKRGGHDALLLLADTEGDIKTVEISSNHAATRKMVDNQIINTNHYLETEMQQYEIPHNAVLWGKTIPEDMKGIRVHESSEQRLRRAEELLRDKVKVDEDKIVTILRDHGKDDKPSWTTICRHGKYGSTLRSMIFYPDRKTMKVLYGRPCQNEYVEFTF